MTLSVKICGLSTPETLEAALRTGADFVGFVFHPKSPRFVTPDQAATLARQVAGRAKTVALVVDADDATLDTITRAMAPDWWQAHGSETAERLTAIRARYNRPVLKATGWTGPEDRNAVLGLADAADHLLLDAKPPKGAAYPGGHGRAFDWTSLAVLPPDLPFMLSGGLTPETVAGAIRTVRGLGLSLSGVDVSSGVETTPGQKDIAKIAAFVAAARSAG